MRSLQGPEGVRSDSAMLLVDNKRFKRVHPRQIAEVGRERATRVSVWL